MEHIEDLIFNEGVNGTRRAIFFLRDLRDMLSGHVKSKVTTTVKWDGAPAIVAGIDPNDGKFFVAKKGAFNKTPKLYKSKSDIVADTSGDLQKKMIVAFEEFSKLGIKSGIYQGDLMFTAGDIKKEKIEDTDYYTFQPNTIVYAIPANSQLGKQLIKKKIGIVWHTVYSGKSFESMSASFGKDIVKNFKSVNTIWQVNATLKDVSGNATFTDSETQELNNILSEIGKTFNKVPGRLIDEFRDNNELKIRTKTFINTFIRAGEIPDAKKASDGLMDYIYNYYQKEIDNRKTDKAKEEWTNKRKETMSVFTKYNRQDFFNVFTLMNLMVDAKNIIIRKMNSTSKMDMFVRVRDGFKVTGPEGYVAIDKLKGGAVKIVDRLSFSYANFSPDVIKGWER
jgi:hypothetical protein